LNSNLDLGITLIALAPFFAAALAPFIHRFAKSFSGWVLAIIPASIFVYLLGFVQQVANGDVIKAGFDWIPYYELRMSFYLDGLSVTFALLISGIGTFIILYSGAYLKGHLHQGRFLSFMLMFMGSMLGLVISDNLVSLFVFWELTAITSFLLIGFDHVREASRRAAIQALVVTGLGGLALLAAIVLLRQFTGVWDISDIFAWGEAIKDGNMYLPILLLVILAAFTKSAQFPFHFWLPNAMEAPTPVSAYLHSATMVKAGVYLLARFNPILGETFEWGLILQVFGGFTLLWGASMAMKQTDLKQMLAQTTIASLGLLVLLIGIGTEVAITAAILYLLSHAFYKGALFMVAGSVDHSTGTRDIRELGGLWKTMPLTFAAAAIGVAGMAGIPATVAFMAKEEMYAVLELTSGADLFTNWPLTLAVIVMIAGNAMMMAVGLSMLFKVFFGEVKSTPKKSHEGSLSIWIGSLVLGGFSLWAGTQLYYFTKTILIPAASAVAGFGVEAKLYIKFSMITTLPFALSTLTWILGVVIFFAIPDIRAMMRASANRLGWSFDKIFDWLIFGLVRLSARVTGFLHHGRLEIYLVVVFVGFALALILPLLGNFTMPAMPPLETVKFYEWAIFAMALVGLIAVAKAKTRLIAIVSLGIQGFAVALIFMLFGAPDLGFTQFMVETLSVVILALVMTRLSLEQRDFRSWGEIIRDGSLAIAIGVGVTMVMYTILQTPLDTRLSDLFALTSVPLAHGSNIVNVILVDYRGVDTLGEISVVLAAGIAIIALIRIRAGGRQTGSGVLKKASATARKKTSKSSKAAKSGSAGKSSKASGKATRATKNTPAAKPRKTLAVKGSKPA